MNEFEQKLSRQPLKEIPGEWRADILREGRRDAGLDDKWDAGTASLPKWNWLAEIFWPNQKAWACLAVVWIFIVAVDFSLRDPSPRIVEKSAPPSPEVIVELRKQQLLFAELMGPRETPDADRPKIFPPRPRSERDGILMA